MCAKTKQKAALHEDRQALGNMLREAMERLRDDDLLVPTKSKHHSCSYGGRRDMNEAAGRLLVEKGIEDSQGNRSKAMMLLKNGIEISEDAMLLGREELVKAVTGARRDAAVERAFAAIGIERTPENAELLAQLYTRGYKLDLETFECAQAITENGIKISTGSMKRVKRLRDIGVQVDAEILTLPNEKVSELLNALWGVQSPQIRVNYYFLPQIFVITKHFQASDKKNEAFGLLCLCARVAPERTEEIFNLIKSNEAYCQEVDAFLQTDYGRQFVSLLEQELSRKREETGGKRPEAA